MTMTMTNEPVSASLLWMQRFDPLHVCNEDLTPEECVSVIDCMVKERSIRECCELTGLSISSVAYWYEQSDRISRIRRSTNGRKVMESAGEQADS